MNIITKTKDIHVIIDKVTQIMVDLDKTYILNL